MFYAKLIKRLYNEMVQKTVVFEKFNIDFYVEKVGGE